MRIPTGRPVRPFVDYMIDAGNDIRIDVTSLDFHDVLEAPTSMRYRIDNLTDRVAITDWTAISSPAESTSLSISAATNAMSNTTSDRQLNQVTFEANFADGTKAKDIVCYELCRVYEV